MVHDLILHKAKQAEEAIVGLALVQPQAMLAVDPSILEFANPAYFKVIEIAKANTDTRRIHAEAFRLGLTPAQVYDLAAKAGLACEVGNYVHDMRSARQAQNLELLGHRHFQAVQDNPQVEVLEVVQWIEGELLRGSVSGGCVPSQSATVVNP